MAEEKKLVEAITSMDVDFAQWYTDVVKKAELMGYSSVKGCMILNQQVMQSGKISRRNWTEDLRKQALKMYICRCSFRKAC